MDNSHMKPKSLWLLFLGILSLIGLGLTFGRVLKNSSAAEDNFYPVSFTAHAQTQSTPSAPESLCAQGLPEADKLPLEKQAMTRAEYQGCLAARQSPLAPPNSKPQPQTATPPPMAAIGIARRVAGAGSIIEHGLAPLPGMAYVILNSWQREADGKRTTVYAGARRDDPGGSPDASQGIIAVLVDTLDFKALPEDGGEYQTPVQAGPVRIADAKGMQLTLVTPDGQGFFFNVASRQFVLPGPTTPVKRGAGAGQIIESRANSLSMAGDDFVNQWSEEINGQRLTVLAGSEHQNAYQGILVIVITPLSNATTRLSRERYITPVQFGAVRVVEANGEQLTLATSEGGRFVFDVASRQFVSWPEMP
jgi:hypothetical protein